MATTTKTVQTKITKIGLFSGGRDSLTACHVLWKKGELDEVCYCRTGVGLNEDYVVATCKKYGWKLNIITPKYDDEYERFCRRYGFPRPTSHTWIMHRLKLNPLRYWHNREKQNRAIEFVSGIRLKESSKRMKNFRKDGYRNTMEGMTFIKPISEWSKQDVLDYIKKHKLEISPIYATMGISGDCFCGAYAKRHESMTLMKFHPELAKKLMDLENEKEVRFHWGSYTSITACTGQRTIEGMVCNECLRE